MLLGTKLVEVTIRLKGLVLLDTVPEDLWMEVCNIVQETVAKIIPKGKKCKKAKWLSEKAFRQIAEERREEESNDDTTLMQKVKRNQRAS